MQNTLRFMNSTMIFNMNSFTRIQPWFHDILHSTEFTYQFMIMILYMISLSWIFIYDFIILNSLAWIQRWIHIHKFWYMISRYSSRLWIRIWIYIMKSYKISWSWIHMRHFITWNHVYQGSRCACCTACRTPGPLYSRGRAALLAHPQILAVPGPWCTLTCQRRCRGGDSRCSPRSVAFINFYDPPKEGDSGSVIPTIIGDDTLRLLKGSKTSV